MSSHKPPAERVRDAEAAAIKAGGIYVPRTLLQGDDAILWRRLRSAHGDMAAEALRTAIRATAQGGGWISEKLSPYQRRIVSEKIRLDGWIEELRASIGTPEYYEAGIHYMERVQRRVEIMEAYSAALGAEINAGMPEPPQT